MVQDFCKIWKNRRFEGIKYSLAPDKNYTEIGNQKAIYLVSLESKYKGKGNAKRFLAELIAVANETRTPISLIPDADIDEPGALNQSQLKNFYSRFGFELATGGLEMIYYPIN